MCVWRYSESNKEDTWYQRHQAGKTERIFPRIKWWILLSKDEDT